MSARVLRRLVGALTTAALIMSLIAPMAIAGEREDKSGSVARVITTMQYSYDDAGNPNGVIIDTEQMEDSDTLIWTTYDTSTNTVIQTRMNLKTKVISDTKKKIVGGKIVDVIEMPSGDLAVSDQTNNKVYLYDGTTLEKKKEADTALDPNQIFFNSKSNTLYVSHTGQNVIYGLDGTTLNKSNNTYTAGPVAGVTNGNGSNIIFGEYIEQAGKTNIYSYLPGSNEESELIQSISGIVKKLFRANPDETIKNSLVYFGDNIGLGYIDSNGSFVWNRPAASGDSACTAKQYQDPNSTSRADSVYQLAHLSNEDGTLNMLNMDTGAVEATVGGLGTPDGISFTEDGRYAIVVDDVFSGIYLIDFAPEADEPEDPVYTIGLTQNDAAVTDVAVSKGKTVKIVAQAYIDGVYNAKLTKKIKWATSDKKIATVSKGKIKGKKAGIAIITASLKTEGVSAAVNVTVN